MCRNLTFGRRPGHDLDQSSGKKAHTQRPGGGRLQAQASGPHIGKGLAAMLDVILEPGLARNPVGTEDSLRIACLGECMIEMAPAREAHGPFRLGAAGDSFNTAVHLARLEGGGAPRAATWAMPPDRL